MEIEFIFQFYKDRKKYKFTLHSFNLQNHNGYHQVTFVCWG